MVAASDGLSSLTQFKGFEVCTFELGGSIPEPQGKEISTHYHGIEYGADAGQTHG